MKSSTARMFNAIAPSYDRINTILSLGIHRYWRKQVSKFIPQEPFSLLDCATGTGDLLLHLLQTHSHITQGVGIDPADQMLRLAQMKVKDYASKVNLVDAYMEFLPFADHSFDVISVAFGIRNVTQLSKSLQEAFRVLKPKGKLMILEFSHPTLFLFKSLYFFYLQKVLPWIGKFFSKHKDAYHYLANTIQTFPQGKDFCYHLKQVGFSSVHMHRLSLGIVTLYIGEKK